MAGASPTPLVSSEQLVTAMKALGLLESYATPSQVGEDAFMIGSLLAILETIVYRDIQDDDMTACQEGYWTILLTVCDRDPDNTARAWSLLLHDRLKRTGQELETALNGSGREFVETIIPAIFIAANLVNATNYAGPQRELLPEMVEAARMNLATLASGIDRLGAPPRGSML